MNRNHVSQSALMEQLLALGVAPGSVLLVHCAFSRVGPVEGGPVGLIRALQSALGPAGTLVMPSMTDDDDNVFDPRSTPCPGMGVVADSFWRLPAVLRSDSPHAFAASGLHAAAITAPHPIDFPHGLDSPVGRVFELDGQVLLLGVGHDANTTIHLAEALAGVRYRRPKQVCARVDGSITRIAYGEIDHCCQNFDLVDGWLDASGLQRRGRVGAQRRGWRVRAISSTWSLPACAPMRRHFCTRTVTMKNAMRREPALRCDGLAAGDEAFGMTSVECD